MIRLVRAASKVLEAPDLRGVNVHEEKWASAMEDLVSLIETGSKLSKLRAQFDEVIIPEAWGQDVLLVRKALVAAFDFNWLNKNLFHSAYTRTVSYFGGSELEAPLVPGSGEIALDKSLSADATCDICTPLDDILAPRL